MNFSKEKKEIMAWEKKIGKIPERFWVCYKCQKFEGTLEQVQEYQSKCDLTPEKI